MNFKRKFPIVGKGVSVDLYGGLGNQLFCFFAGLEISLKNNLPLFAKISTADYQHHQLKFDISGIKFNFDSYRLYRDWIYEAPGGRLLFKLYDSARFRSQVFEKITDLTHGYILESDIGEDISVKRRAHVRAHANTFAPFDFCESFLGPIAFQPRQVSTEFLNLSEFVNSREVISVHVRRGDFINQKDQIGLLSSHYYHDAINSLISQFEFSEILVFSDNLEMARNLIGRNESALPISYVNSLASPIEELKLISKARGIVMANSGFSAWAAKFSKLPSQRIIGPTQFYRDSRSNELEWDDSWTHFQPTWE